MNKKIGFSVAATLFIVAAMICVPLTSAQVKSWDYCKLSAYGDRLNDYAESSSNTERFEFYVAVPPSGSNITNTLEVMNYETGENYTLNLTDGNVVYLEHQYRNPIQMSLNQASEADHYIIFYEGEVAAVTVNRIDIPEFSSILIIPLFITATLLAIFYRRKKTS